MRANLYVSPAHRQHLREVSTSISLPFLAGNALSADVPVQPDHLRDFFSDFFSGRYGGRYAGMLEEEDTLADMLRTTPQCKQFVLDLGTWLLEGGRLNQAVTQLGLVARPSPCVALSGANIGYPQSYNAMLDKMAGVSQYDRRMLQLYLEMHFLPATVYGLVCPDNDAPYLVYQPVVSLLASATAPTPHRTHLAARARSPTAAPFAAVSRPAVQDPMHAAGQRAVHVGLPLRPAPADHPGAQCTPGHGARQAGHRHRAYGR